MAPSLQQYQRVVLELPSETFMAVLEESLWLKGKGQTIKNIYVKLAYLVKWPVERMNAKSRGLMVVSVTTAKPLSSDWYVYDCHM